MPGTGVISFADGDNGTQTQKDEPQAQNPPAGACIDYCLKTAAAAVTLEVLDAGGAIMQTFSNERMQWAAGAGAKPARPRRARSLPG